MNTRRTFLGRAFGACSALFAARGLSAQMQMQMPMPMPPASANPQPPHTVAPYSHVSSQTSLPTPVVTTDVGDLAYTMDGSTKVFHLTAEVLRQRIHPDKTIDLWGFNGTAPGPTIQVLQGDHVRVVFENHLPEPCSLHWHGFEDMIGNDGMPGISQEPVKPGGRYVYEFDIHQSGTYFYHSHMAMQEMTGMLGGFIMHPRTPYHPHCDKDFLLHLQEYAVLPNNTVPNTMNMEYNWLLLNGKAGPASTPLIVCQGDRVRIRFVNMGMDHHPMHIHGYTFQVTGTEGGRIPQTAWWPGTTVLVGVAQARDIEITADRVGDWMLHCHLPHHMMNQMSSNVGRMTRSAGQPAGVDMNTGMGMLQGTPGAPTGDDYGTSLGRGMGFGSDADMATTNGPLAQKKGMTGMAGMAGMSGMSGMTDIAANANSVPGFPQDVYMEGPSMAMDQRVEKPENYGLRAGWSGYMMGMMTFLRVLPADKYQDVMARVKQAQRPNDPYASLLQKIS
jgi:FtsP/CotA-like multicopper oxidase with cupredoxin domain